MNLSEKEILLINNHLLDTLTEREKELVEERILEDAEFATELNLQRDLNLFLSQKSTESFVYKTIPKKNKQALVEASNAYFEKPKTTFKLRSLNTFILSAAAISLLGFLLFFNNTYSNQELFENYYVDRDKPSFTTRSASSSDIVIAYSLYKEGKLEEAATALKNNPAQDDINKSLLLGIIYLEQGSYQTAIDYFTEFKKSNSLDAQKGSWFIALTYLRSDNKEEAIKALEKITGDPNNYKYKEAMELLELLN